MLLPSAWASDQEVLEQNRRLSNAVQRFARETDNNKNELDHVMVLLVSFVAARSADSVEGLKDREAVERVQGRYINMLRR